MHPPARHGRKPAGRRLPHDRCARRGDALPGHLPAPTGSVASASSWYTSYACVDTWLTDFRADVAKIDIPVIVVHGTAERILPFDSTAKRLKSMIADVEVVPIENGPHNVGWTFPEECNAALLKLLS